MGRLVSGDMVGKWRVHGILGAGAMGVVYEVEHCVTGKHAALKMLKASGADAAVMAAKLLSEARLLARQQHPHLVDVYDASDGAEGEPWMVMERLTGRDLSHIIKQGPLPVDRALGFAEAIASAVACAHAAGVVHRDLKPANIHVSDTDVVKVIDFGASRFAAGRTLNQRVGTIPYMSPEQLLRPDQVDGRSDIWALGLVIYQMLCGRHIFQDELGVWLPRAQVLHAIQAPTPLSTYRDVDARTRSLLLKATARDPDHRFPSMDDLAAAIQRIRRTIDTRDYLPTERISAAELTLQHGSVQPAGERPWSCGNGTADLDLTETMHSEPTRQPGSNRQRWRRARQLAWICAAGALSTAIIMAWRRSYLDVAPGATTASSADLPGASSAANRTANVHAPTARPLIATSTPALLPAPAPEVVVDAGPHETAPSYAEPRTTYPPRSGPMKARTAPAAPTPTSTSPRPTGRALHTATKVNW